MDRQVSMIVQWIGVKKYGTVRLHSCCWQATDSRQGIYELRKAELLRYRIRYFTDTAIIGSKAFVIEAFAKVRERFSEKKASGSG